MPAGGRGARVVPEAAVSSEAAGPGAASLRRGHRSAHTQDVEDPHLGLDPKESIEVCVKPVKKC